MISIFLTVDEVFSDPKNTEFFLLTTLELDKKGPNYQSKLFGQSKILICNNSQIITINLEFFEKFSLEDFCKFKEEFHTGLSNNVMVRDVEFEEEKETEILGAWPLNEGDCFILQRTNDQVEICKINLWGSSGQQGNLSEKENQVSLKNKKENENYIKIKENEDLDYQLKHLKSMLEKLDPVDFSSEIKTVKMMEIATNNPKITEEEAEKVQKRFSHSLKKLESQIQKRLAKNTTVNSLHTDLQISVENQMGKQNQFAVDLTNKFEEIMIKNGALTKKSSKVYKKLQQISVAYSLGYQNKQLLGMNNRSDVIIKEQLKDNQKFMRILEADLLQVGQNLNINYRLSWFGYLLV